MELTASFCPAEALRFEAIYLKPCLVSDCFLYKVKQSKDIYLCRACFV